MCRPLKAKRDKASEIFGERDINRKMVFKSRISKISTIEFQTSLNVHAIYDAGIGVVRKISTARE